MDLTILMAAPDAPLKELLFKVETGLVEAGFRHDFSVLRAGYDVEREVFDERMPTEEVRVEGGFDELPPEVSLWEGVAFEFWRDSLSLSLMIGRIGAGQCVNAWVDVPLRMLTRLLETQEEGRLYGALGEIAGAIGAAGGYVHTELAFHTLPLDRAQTAFVDMPEYPGEAALLGILPAQAVGPEQVAARFPAFTAKLSTRGYWVLTQDLAGTLLP